MVREPLPRRFRCAEQGNFATLAALLSPVAIGLAAVAVDIGSLTLERRTAQSLADIAALTAVSDIGEAEALAATVFTDNGVTPVIVDAPGEPTTGPIMRVVTGRLDPTRAAGSRFVADAEPANAVRIDYRRKGQLHFGGSFMEPPTIAVSAVATQAAEGAFSIGSRLASLEGGIANAVLGALLGAELSLSVMDYEALIDADVSLFAFLDELAIETGATAGTYDQLLATNGTLAQLARALSRAEGLPSSVRSVLSTIAASPEAADIETPLNLLIELGSAGLARVGTAGGGLDVDAGVLEMLTAAASIANGTRQVALDLGASVPGLLDLGLDLAIGEPPVEAPWLEMGEAGAEIRTAQARLLLSVRIGGPGGAVGSLIHLPIYVELAPSTAALSAVSCPSGRPDSARMTIAARPGVAELRIAAVDPAQLDDFTEEPRFSPATLVDAALVKVRADSRIAIESASDAIVEFDAADIEARAIKSVSTTTVASSLAASLIDDLDLDIDILGLDLGLSGLVSTTLRATLEPLAPAIDEVLATVLDALGVKIGEADIRANGVRCGRAVLVQ